MDVRRAELHRDRGQVCAVVADGQGEKEVVLRGLAAARLLEVAAPLLADGNRLLLDWIRGAYTRDGAPLDELLIQSTATSLARAIVDEVRIRPAGTEGERDAALWSRLYQVGGDGWELGRAAPPLVRWAEAHRHPGRRTLVPGCGRGHEARVFAALGDEVTGVDFSADALAEARKLTPPQAAPIEWRLADVFRLRESPDRWDLVVEHTCFCAIPVERRDEYLDVMADVLASDGILVGLFWDHGRPGGPPFTVSRRELEVHLARRFVLDEITVPPDSVATRRGDELLVVARRAHRE